MPVKLAIKLRNDNTRLTLSFNSEIERDRCFQSLRTTMSKVTLDVFYSDTLAIKIEEISYIEKI